MTNKIVRIDEWQAEHEELDALLAVLPPAVRTTLEQESREGLLEVVLDLGRLPEARFLDHDIYLGGEEVTEEDIQYVLARLSPFGDDNRSGIERTLHRISAIRNRAGEVIGLTCRVGRAVRGSARVVEEFAMSGKSVLLVGRPGVGKTTILRELARVLADTSRKRVVIVDTSNEIAGDGDIPHPAIGRSRRMQVSTPARQHAVMIEAVENHMPEVIVVDEMGTELEAAAARTIAERGVQLIATAHGNTLENLLVNPTLSDLIGGVQTVTLGDEEARRRRTQKTILERKAPPTFDVLVEILGWNRIAVHADVAKTVDAVLRGRPINPEVRELDESGAIRRSWQRRSPEVGVQGDSDRPFSSGVGDGGFERSREPRAPREPRPASQQAPVPETAPGESAGPAIPAVRVYPFGVNKEKLAQAAVDAGMAVHVADNVAEAEMVLTTKAHFRRRAGTLQAAEEQNKPVFVLRRNTPGQIIGFLQQVSRSNGGGDLEDSVNTGTTEAEDGVSRILNGDADTVALQPQSAFVRRVQHQIAEDAHLRSHSVGREPKRHVTIRRRG